MPNEEELLKEAELSFIESDVSEGVGEADFKDGFEDFNDDFGDTGELIAHLKDDLVHVIHPCWFKISGTLTTGTNKDLSWISPSPLQIEEIFAYVRTAPTGAAINIDINLARFTSNVPEGTYAWGASATLLGATFSIAISANGGSTSAIALGTTPHLNKYDRLDIDLDQVGSGTAGADLSVFVKFKLL